MAMHVTVDTLLDRVKAIAPMLRAYAAEAEAQRRWPAPWSMPCSRRGCIACRIPRRLRV